MKYTNLVDGSHNRGKQGAGGFTSSWVQYRSHAKERNHEWDLDKKQFLQLTQGNCYYCGKEPSNIVYTRSGRRTKPETIKLTGYKCNGIDRKINTEGYNIDNCVPCCFICNRMKMNMEFIDFIFHLERMHEHLHRGIIDKN